MYERILKLHGCLPPPDKQVMGLVFLARGRWRDAVTRWKKTGDDSALKTFREKFTTWTQTADSVLVARVLLELGRQTLKPGRAGSMFMGLAPTELLRRLYLS